ncbi:Transmembrane protein 35A [Porphyridium purpureum]|uniref:Transmembrane protein 35A n=1 Tax=Porphyridium purpureum TaxID=35688 RepID=A0A5J4Z514_PORPP|nr:Transmembrane protein 35A [Porphyridium purpureum]|eukprot:POR7547..scf295_1
MRVGVLRTECGDVANVEGKMPKKILFVAASVLGAFLGVLFAFAGLMKLTPQFDPATHEMMVAGFLRYGEIWKVERFGKTSDEFRVYLGALELGCGLLLTLPLLNSLLWPFCQFVVPLLLVVIMAGATYTHYVLKDPVEALIVPPVLGTLLVAILILYTASAAVANGNAPVAATQESSVSSKKRN